MRRVLLTAAVLLALGVSEAQAHTTITCEGGCSYSYQRWVDEAKVPTPDVTLTVAEQRCPDELHPGCTEAARGIIWLDGPALTRQHDLRHSFLHELGHNADYYLLPEWMRSRFMALAGLTGPWALDGETEAEGPNEYFAETYAECAVKLHISASEARRFGRGPIFGVMPAIGIAGHNAACRMLARL